jgi:hypothetical protein
MISEGFRGTYDFRRGWCLFIDDDESERVFPGLLVWTDRDPSDLAWHNEALGGSRRPGVGRAENGQQREL